LTGHREGWSLIELVMVVAIAGLVAGTVVSTITSQEKFYRGAAQLRSARENVRDALEVLSTDLGGMAAADTVRLRADSAIEFFAAIGASVVCQVSANEVGLAPYRTTGNSLSAFLAEPDTGDVAFFYVRSATDRLRWEPYRIAAFSSRALGESCPASSGFSTQTDIESSPNAYVVTLVGPLRADSPMPGASVRFVRRGRYSLYHAGDGAWYLGYRRCNAVGASVCGGIQPLSGPYRAYSSDPRATGLLFEYFDTTGSRMDAARPSLALGRVDVTARSAIVAVPMFSERSPISDSATVSIALRNRARQ
jgi:type II secretory pathway pseudopilin PulG